MIFTMRPSHMAANNNNIDISEILIVSIFSNIAPILKSFPNNFDIFVGGFPEVNDIGLAPQQRFRQHVGLFFCVHYFLNCVMHMLAFGTSTSDES